MDLIVGAGLPEPAPVKEFISQAYPYPIKP